MKTLPHEANNQSVPCSNNSVNLNVAPYNFGGTREDHSGEFTRSIQQLNALFLTIRTKLAE